MMLLLSKGVPFAIADSEPSIAKFLTGPRQNVVCVASSQKYLSILASSSLVSPTATPIVRASTVYTAASAAPSACAGAVMYSQGSNWPIGRNTYGILNWTTVASGDTKSMFASVRNG